MVSLAMTRSKKLVQKRHPRTDRRIASSPLAYPVDHLIDHAAIFPQFETEIAELKSLRDRFGEDAPRTVAFATKFVRKLTKALDRENLSIDDDPLGQGLGDYWQE